MSRKNTNPEVRAARKARKALRNTPQGYIDLEQYVRFRSRCTAGTARAVLMSGALRVDSHPVGFKHVKDRTGKSVKVLSPLIPAENRGHIVLQHPKEAT